MKKSDFIQKIKEVLEIGSNVEITESTDLNTLDEFDSLADVAFVGMIEKNFNRTLSDDDFENITTVQSLMEIIGIEHFEEG